MAEGESFATSAVARAGIVGDGLVAIVTTGCVVVLAVCVGATSSRFGRLVACCFAAASACAAAYAALSAAPLHSSRPSGSPMLLFVAEAAALTGAALSPVLVRGRIDRRAAFVGMAGGLVVFSMLVANASTTKILLLWNVGLAGYFPAVAYAVAFGAFVYTVAALARSGARLHSLSLMLLLAGGVGLHSTYQTGLVVAGLGVLVLLGAHGTVRLPTEPVDVMAINATMTGLSVDDAGSM